MTGMLILGKMSTGIVTMDSTPMRAINRASTTNVYGRRSASLTIHMIDGGVNHEACQHRPLLNSFTRGPLPGQGRRAARPCMFGITHPACERAADPGDAS